MSGVPVKITPTDRVLLDPELDLEEYLSQEIVAEMNRLAEWDFENFIRELVNGKPGERVPQGLLHWKGSQS